MKLKNKKTGEMGIINYFDNQSIVIYPIDENWNAKGDKKYVYHSIAELNEEWCDYEEPENFYIVEQRGTVGSRFRTGDEYEKMFKEIGNYFETEEEAEKAVEKLKAFKRLKDKGFSFDPVDRYEALCGNGFNIPITATMPPEAYTDTEVSKDLDLLFGGER